MHQHDQQTSYMSIPAQTYAQPKHLQSIIKFRAAMTNILSYFPACYYVASYCE